MTSLYKLAEITPRAFRLKSRSEKKQSSTEPSPSPEEDALSSAITCESVIDLQSDRSARKRQRKSNDQIQVLKEEFLLNPVWTKQDIAELAQRTGLSESQVYKWSWDFRKKTKCEVERPSPDIDPKILDCEELLMPTILDSCIYEVQRGYRIDLNHFRLKGCTPSRYLVSPTRLIFDP